MSDVDAAADTRRSRRRRTWVLLLLGLGEALTSTVGLGTTPLGELAQGMRERARSPLSTRAQEVAETLDTAGRLLDELQAEVRARAAVIEALGTKTEEAEQRAEDAVRRASLNEEEAKAVDAYLDRALRDRITELERSARRREWTIGTIVALVVGVASILISHFALGF